MNKVDELIGMPDAKRLTGLSRWSLKRYAQAGQIHGENIAGRLWVFRREDIEHLAATRCRCRAAA